MQTFLIVVMSILLPVVGIIELFQSNEKEPEKELPIINTPPVIKKGKLKSHPS